MATVTAESLGLSNLTPDQMAAAQQPAMGYNTQAALTPIYSGQSSYFGTPQITGYSGADGTQYNAQGQVTGAASLNGQVYSFDPSTGAVTYQAKADGGGLGATLKNVASNPVIQIAAAIALPGIGEALAGTIADAAASAGITLTDTVAAQVGSAAASVAVQTAQGVPLDKAIENAGVNLLVNTQSQPAVQALNAAIGSPAVASAITSATGSAITAAAQGKDVNQIAQAAAGGAVGGATGAALGTQGTTDVPGVTTPSPIQELTGVTPTQATNLGTALASTLGTALGTGSTQATLASLAGQLGSGNLNSILPGDSTAKSPISDAQASASPYTRTGSIGSQPDPNAVVETTPTTTPTVNVAGTTDSIPTTTSTTQPNVTVTGAKDTNVATTNNTAALINQLGLNNAASTTTPAANVTVTGASDNVVPVTTTTTPTTTTSGTTPADTVTVTDKKDIPVVSPANATTSTTGVAAGPIVAPEKTAITGPAAPLQNVEVVDSGNIPAKDQAIIDLIGAGNATPSAGTVNVVGQRDVPTAVTGTSGSSAPSAGTVEVVGQRDIPTSNAAVTGAGPTSVPDAGTVVVTGQKDIPTSNTAVQNYGNVDVVGQREIPTSYGTVDVVGQREIPTADTAIKNYGNIDVVAPRPTTTDMGNVTVTDTKEIPTVDVTDTFIPETVDSSQVANVQAPELSNIPLSITAGPSKTSSLARALGVAPQITTGTTQGLTSGGEGGEIQSLETGKPRRNVWNESSLRLRDALGLE